MPFSNDLLTLSQILAYSMCKLSSSSIKIAIIGSLNEEITVKLAKILRDTKVEAKIYLHSNKDNFDKSNLNENTLLYNACSLSNLRELNIVYLDYKVLATAGTLKPFCSSTTA